MLCYHAVIRSDFHNELFNSEKSLDTQCFAWMQFLQWPSSPFRIISLMILKRNFDYFCSSCGTYLASQGDGPDQYLTIWKWKEEKMVARKSAPAPEHYQLAFSNDQHTKITSCGKLTGVLLNFVTCFTRHSLHFTWFFASLQHTIVLGQYHRYLIHRQQLKLLPAPTIEWSWALISGNDTIDCPPRR